VSSKWGRPINDYESEDNRYVFKKNGRTIEVNLDTEYGSASFRVSKRDE
jgi:hypothetical protein